MAGDVACGVGREEDGCAGEFVQLSKTSHRRTCEKFLAAFGAVEQAGVQLRSEYARSNGIDANAFSGPFDGERFGERSDGSFAGAVSGDFVESDERGKRRNINDAAVAAFDHVAADDAAGAQCAGEICFEDAVPLGVGNIHGGCAFGATGGIHENLYAAEFLASRVQQSFDGDLVGDIARNCQRASADGANFFCRGANEVDAASGRDNVRTGLREPFGDFESNAARAADNERSFFVKFQARMAQVLFLLTEVPKAFRFYSNRSEEHTSELQSPCNLVCRLLLAKKQ